MEMFRNLNSEIGYNFALKSYEYVLLSKKNNKNDVNYEHYIIF